MIVAVVCLTVVVVVQQFVILSLATRQPRRRPAQPRVTAPQDVDRTVAQTLHAAQVAMGDLPARTERTSLVGLNGGF